MNEDTSVQQLKLECLRLALKLTPMRNGVIELTGYDTLVAAKEFYEWIKENE